MPPLPVRIDAVPAESTYDVRRRVLRGGLPDANVSFPEDEVEGAFHLAAVDERGEVVGVASFSPEGEGVWRLRGMAVELSVQGRGVGVALLDEAVRRLRSLGATRVWANGRDTALAFYERCGWRVVGDGFLSTGDVVLPHHVVGLDL